MSLGGQDSAKPSALRFAELATMALTYGHHLHDPRYMGHQVPPVVPASALFDVLGRAANQGAAVFEMAPFGTAAEKAVVNALDTVEGKALAIDAAVLDGYEVYSVEIEGVDGKSYDVFVDPMDGEVLAYDAYEMSAEEVEAAGDNGSLSVKTVEDPEFAASLMEFALLEAETDTPPADAS
jgi:hypothetical protein